MALAALVAVAGCAFALVFRQPAIALLFPARQLHRGFHAAGFGGVPGAGPEPGGLEPDRDRGAFPVRARPALAAGDRRRLPVIFNVAITLRLQSWRPELIGLDSTLGLLAGAIALFVMAHLSRKSWSA